MSDELVFAQEELPPGGPPAQALPPWKILVADDEQAVHLVTRLALGDFTFEGRKLQLFSAYNEADTRRIMAEEPDMALVLLDVVMDTVNSGFDLVKFIRQDLRNADVRIVMRTGQSGNAPEDRVIIDYDINDFKDKTELTVSKLRTTIISSLRALSHLKIIEDERRKLAESRSYLEQLLNTLPSLVITINARQQVVLWNRTAEAWLGLSAAGVQGQVLWTATSEFDPLKKIIQECLEGHRVFEQSGVPFMNRSQKVVNFFLYPLSLGPEAQLIIRMDDATLNRKQEEQSSRSRRFQAMTVFTEGFAREMERLGAIAREGMGPDGTCSDPQPAMEALQSLQGESRKILDSLRLLSKKNDQEPKLIDLVPLVDKILKEGDLSSWGLKPARIPGNPAMILGNAQDTDQAIREVLANARDALSGKSAWDRNLLVSLSRQVPDPQLRREHPEAEDRPYWVLEVRDNGPGMVPEIMERIFDPYFSTKSDRPGAGLGMSLVFNILGLHGGFIHLESEVEKGTSIQLYWPEAAEEKSRGRLPVSAFKGEGTILVCDDEAMMRQLAGSILQRFGFRILQASDGYSALEVFQENRKDIRLVILDMLMPGLQGLELFRKLREVQPEVQVLISSGFGQSDQVEQALKEGAAGFLQKPYGYEKLGKIIFEILG